MSMSTILAFVFGCFFGEILGFGIIGFIFMMMDERRKKDENGTD